MTFGEKLRELRLNAKMGMHRFKEKMGTTISVKELYDIEYGFSKEPGNTRYAAQIKKALGLSHDHPDWMELLRLSREPFVMQEMPEDIALSPFTHKSDGTLLKEDELSGLCEHIKDIAIEHNKKAKEYNRTGS